MRYSQIKPLHEQRLDEINMSPSSLRQLAGKIEGARAGLEFELVIPGISSDDDYVSEPDYNADESVSGIASIIDFFDENDANGRVTLRRLREKLDEEFYEWQIEQLSDKFAAEDLAQLLTDYFESEEGLEGDELEAAVSDELSSPGRAYDSVRETWEEYHRDEFDDEDWLRSQGYRRMSDISDSYSVDWPYYTTGSAGDQDPEDIAKDFSKAIGRQVEYSSGYHATERQDVGSTHYIAEPDASIEGNDGEGGLEFVSPPLTIPEMITDLNQVVKWCQSSGAYTNGSTGLHINISVPGYDVDNLDFIKLALLMGDEYVSNSFGRLGASYAKSALGIIRKKAAADPAAVQRLMDQMRVHLNTAASKLVHSGATDKFTSINTKDGRVEFRSPGGDWLTDFSSGKVENTMLRFVVALDAAVDETKYKDEYAKKLYKLLAPADDGSNTMQYFTKYVAGDMPKAALKSFVKQAQLQRTIKKSGGVEPGKMYWWRVSLRRNPNSSTEVISNSAKEAIDQVVAQNDGPWTPVAADYEAVAVRPYVTDQSQSQSQSPTQQFELYRIDNDQAVLSIQAATMQDALTKAEAYLRSQGLGNAGFNVRLATAGEDARRAARNEADRQRAVAAYTQMQKQQAANAASTESPQ